MRRQPEFFKFVLDNGIVPIGFCPIGSPTRPDRDKTPEDTVDIEDPVIVQIAKRLGVHPAVVCVKWAVQMDFSPPWGAGVHPACGTRPRFERGGHRDVRLKQFLRNATREKANKLSQFGYKNFVPLFKAGRFDPVAWAALFKQAGARYVVPVIALEKLT